MFIQPPRANSIILPSLHTRFLFTIPQSSLSRASGIWNKLHSRTGNYFSPDRNSSLISISFFSSFFPLSFFFLSLSLFSNDYWRVIAGERNRRTLTSIFENQDLDPLPPSLKAKQSYFLDDCIIISLHFRRDIFRIIFKRDKSIIKIQSMEKRGVQRRIQDLVQDGNTKIYI